MREAANMEIFNHRGGLVRFRDAVNNRGSVRVGFIGGSITQECVKINWPEFVAAWVKNAAGNKPVYIENMGIGGTGSDIAAFRFDREMASKDCDLIFVEFAVNDEEFDTHLRRRSREGLVRKILSKTRADIVFVYTYIQSMLPDMMADRTPKSIAEFEEIAQHYEIGSVWMAKSAFDMVNEGLMSFENFLGDGLHPNQLGSGIYANAVIQFLSREMSLTSAAAPRSVQPLYADNWEKASVVPFEQITTKGCWYIRSLYNYDFRHTLYTSSLTAVASVTCKCKTMVVCRLHGTRCGMFKYRIDGGEWITEKKDVAVWMGGADYPWQIVLIDDTKESEHTVEFMCEKTERECGSSLYIAYIGIV